MTSDCTDSSNTATPQYWDRLRHHWLVACRASDLRRTPIRRVVLGEVLVLLQSAGQIVALRDSCPHRNAPLSAGKLVNGCIQCPYHGWQFNTAGECTFRPGIREPISPPIHVSAFETFLENGLVWVRLQPGPSDRPPNRPWSDGKKWQCFLWRDTVSADFVDALENLLDATHTPFVHSGLVRSENSQQKFTAIVRSREGYAEAEYVNEGKQSGLISRLFERNRSSSFGRFFPPGLAELEYTSTRGTEFVLNSWFTPETADRLQVYSQIYLRRSWIPISVKRLVVGPFLKRVLRQDQHILELQQDNIQQTGRDFTSWDGDVIRGLIETWLRTGQMPEKIERKIELEL